MAAFDSTAPAHETGLDKPAVVEAPGGQRAILDAAVEAFFERGYHHTSMRDITGRAGVSISHLYYHFPSKLDLLYAIMRVGIQDLIDELLAERERAGADPVARFAAMLRVHARFHARRRELALIGNSELRSLDAAGRERIVALRDQVGALFLDEVLAGVVRSAFDVAWPREAVRAILDSCTAIAGWYRPDGSDGPDVVADRAVAIALRALGFRPPRGGGAAPMEGTP
jgi:AcrR family transcriptional regulator